MQRIGKMAGDLGRKVEEMTLRSRIVASGGV